MTTNETGIKSNWETIIKEGMPEPHAQSIIKHVVKFEPSELFNDMAKFEHNEMERVMRFTDNSIVLDHQEMTKYIHTVLWLRVMQVTNQLTGKFKDYRFASKTLNIPVRLYQIVLSLGEAVDRDYGLRFVPEMEIASDKLLTASQLRDMSDRLSVLIPEGYLVVETGLPNELNGELGFMACLVTADERVYSYRKDHPVYGFIASFFDTELLNKAFEMDYKIYYGARSDYGAMLSRIYRK